MRPVRLAGTSNLRCLGGYRTTTGLRVKQGIVFRGDSLHHVTEADAQEVLVRQLGVKDVFDFRTTREVNEAPYHFRGIQHHHVPIGESLLGEYAKSGKSVSPEVLRGLIQETYRRRIDRCGAAFGKVFRHMIDTPVGSERAILFHCTAGKDRTGLMAALLLHALRVEEDTILEDYLLTNQLFRRPKRAADRKGGLTLDSASLDVLWGVDAAFLRETFRHMNGTYFGVDGYLKSVVGLTESDIDRLGSVLLEPAG